jgi:hypothetical protein
MKNVTRNFRRARTTGIPFRAEYATHEQKQLMENLKKEADSNGFQISTQSAIPCEEQSID